MPLRPRFPRLPTRSGDRWHLRHHRPRIQRPGRYRDSMTGVLPFAADRGLEWRWKPMGIESPSILRSAFPLARSRRNHFLAALVRRASAESKTGIGGLARCASSFAARSSIVCTRRCFPARASMRRETRLNRPRINVRSRRVRYRFPLSPWPAIVQRAGRPTSVQFHCSLHLASGDPIRRFASTCLPARIPSR